MADKTLEQGQQLAATDKVLQKEISTGVYALAQLAVLSVGDEPVSLANPLPVTGGVSAADLAVPPADSASNILMRDVVGNKTDTGALTAGTASVVALARKGAKEAWETEHHFHVRERWLGLAGASEGWTPYALPVGNGGTFGAWTEILDAADTPIIAGSTHYDPHRILLTDVPQDKEVLFIQFAWGATGAGGYGDGDYTEVYDFPEKPTAGKSMPLLIKFPRLPTDTLLWARAKQETADAIDGTVDFFIGIHEYTDLDV